MIKWWRWRFANRQDEAILSSLHIACVIDSWTRVLNPRTVDREPRVGLLARCSLSRLVNYSLTVVAADRRRVTGCVCDQLTRANLSDQWWRCGLRHRLTSRSHVYCCGVKPMSVIIASFKLGHFTVDDVVQVCVWISFVVAESRLCDVIDDWLLTSSKQTPCAGWAWSRSALPTAVSVGVSEFSGDGLDIKCFVAGYCHLEIAAEMWR